MKTYSAKPSEVIRNWYLIDAADLTLGRLATEVAMRLMGKHKATYTAHIDTGDNVVIINAARIGVTGNKREDKFYYRHSGYPGGIKQRSLAEQLERDPAEVINAAVKGMLPKNRLQSDRMNRLKVYPLADHPHAGQTPTILEVKEAKRG